MNFQIKEYKNSLETNFIDRILIDIACIKSGIFKDNFVDSKKKFFQFLELKKGIPLVIPFIPEIIEDEKEDIIENTADLKENVEDKIDELKEKVEDKIDDLKEKVEDKHEDVKEKASTFKERFFNAISSAKRSFCKLISRILKTKDTECSEDCECYDNEKKELKCEDNCECSTKA